MRIGVGVVVGDLVGLGKPRDAVWSVGRRTWRRVCRQGRRRAPSIQPPTVCRAICSSIAISAGGIEAKGFASTTALVLVGCKHTRWRARGVVESRFEALPSTRDEEIGLVWSKIAAPAPCRVDPKAVSSVSPMVRNPIGIPWPTGRATCQSCGLARPHAGAAQHEGQDLGASVGDRPGSVSDGACTVRCSVRADGRADARAAIR